MDDKLNVSPLTIEKSSLKRNALSGEVAVVTGGSSNIGLGVARSLAWLGAKVVIAARNQELGMAAAALIDRENGPGTALFVPTDVSNEASMKAMAQQAFARFGKVDILVNNAMDMSLGAPILKTTVAQLDRQYEIAVRGALLGIQAFVPGMQERKHGVVTYLATTFCAPAGQGNYCATKSATSSMMMSLAAELGPVRDSGVAVFMFIPTLVGRPRTAAASPVGPSNRGGAPSVFPGYGSGPLPPEDAGAALAYCIVRAADIHGSGVNVWQAMKRMKWPFPVPESVPPKEFDRIRDPVMVRMFGYVGPGWPENPDPLVTVDRSKAPAGEPSNIGPLF